MQEHLFPLIVSGKVQRGMPTSIQILTVKVMGEGPLLTIDMGATSLATFGLATAIPPTALVTDTAGVNTPSASVKLVPKRLY